MRIILLGAPGAGKGTQAAILAQYFSIPVISTGVMLREAIAAGSVLGKTVQAVMAKGQLVADDMIISLVKDRLAQSDCHKGYLLDGFPRTLEQASAMKSASINIDKVVYLSSNDEQIVERISGRLVDAESGRTYHRLYNPPKVTGKDDQTGRLLTQREDDKEETVRHRLSVYREQTEPLLTYYRSAACEAEGSIQFYEIDGTQEVAEVSSAIIEAMEKAHENN